MTTFTTQAFIHRTLFAAGVLALAGCAVGPDYRRPDLPVAQHYTELKTEARLQADGQVASAELPQSWWELYRSPALDELVRAGLANNPSVASAQAALQVAIENRRAQQAAIFPTVGVAYSATRQKVAAPLASPLSSNEYLFNLHTAQVNISYTPDLFGLNRRQVESLKAQEGSQRWNVEATYLTLSSNLVVAAITEAGLRAQVDATRRSIELQSDILQRFRKLQAMGQNSTLDVAQQEAQLASLEASLPPLEKQLALQRDQLKALSGVLPDATLAEFRLDQLSLPEPLPLTLPSTLVEHRPDVLAAEEQLRSASADIGVAVANRLPEVTLGVNSWGSSASSLARLFSPGTTFWTLAGSVGQTVFDGGALQHREAAARAAYYQAAAQYKSTVINAFQNVADALQAIDADAATLAASQRAQDAAERTLAITRRQLELGDASALAVMAAEQSVQQATVATVQARANRLADAAALFQALGGGWWNRPTGATQTSEHVSAD
jgi:NodT family efflux transporter outer membrane factor (OMF) lipoprotein